MKCNCGGSMDMQEDGECILSIWGIEILEDMTQES